MYARARVDRTKCRNKYNGQQSVDCLSKKNLIVSRGQKNRQLTMEANLTGTCRLLGLERTAGLPREGRKRDVQEDSKGGWWP